MLIIDIFVSTISMVFYQKFLSRHRIMQVENPLYSPDLTLRYFSLLNKLKLHPKKKLYIYIYIYRERERDRMRKKEREIEK